MGQQSVKGASNQLTLIPSYLPGHGELENLFRVQKVRGSRALVFNAVDVNKVIVILLAKPP